MALKRKAKVQIVGSLFGFIVGAGIVYIIFLALDIADRINFNSLIGGATAFFVNLIAQLRNKKNYE